MSRELGGCKGSRAQHVETRERAYRHKVSSTQSRIVHSRITIIVSQRPFLRLHIDILRAPTLWQKRSGRREGGGVSVWEAKRTQGEVGRSFVWRANSPWSLRSRAVLHAQRTGRWTKKL